MDAETGFDQYIAKQMRVPEFAKVYKEAKAVVHSVDRALRRLDEARSKVGFSKAELARRAEVPEESVRRLFTAKRSNPTLQTIVRLARVLGLRLGPTRRGLPRKAPPSRYGVSVEG